MGNQVNSEFVAGDSLNSILPSPQAGDSPGYLEPGPPGISPRKGLYWTQPCISITERYLISVCQVLGEGGEVREKKKKKKEGALFEPEKIFEAMWNWTSHLI